jgi:4a-hydroxytetrahydrobiopterin dehydratase
MAIRRRARTDDYLIDAFALLDGWHTNGAEIYRTLPIDDAQHAALTERIQVYSDALQLRPHIRRRNGETRIGLESSEGKLSASEVTLAARIEDAYRTIVGVPIAADS